jgi:hypothetical protein
MRAELINRRDKNPGFSWENSPVWATQERGEFVRYPDKGYQFRTRVAVRFVLKVITLH